MPDIPILEVHNLSKHFKDVQAVDDLSLTVQEFDIYGFLGPNGSGKSTTIRMMLSLLFPDAGQINIFKKPLRKYRREILGNIGAFIEKPDFYEHLSAKKNLDILSWYSGIKVQPKKISEILELVGLNDRSKSKVNTFSKGMKQRLGIAQSLLHDPDLLILDEPASGLDPSGNRDVRELIRYLNKEKGKTIILSSHNLNEIELIANRMLIIKNGKKIIEGEVQSLLSQQEYLTNFQVNDLERSLSLLNNSSLDIVNVKLMENGIQVQCKKQLVSDINSYLVSEGIRVKSIRIEQSLEDYFLNLT